MVTPRALRIVFFGTPAFAVPSFQALLRSRHPVAGVVTQPDRPRGRGRRTSDAPVKAAARAAKVPVLQPGGLKDERFIAALRELGADLGVVAAYGKILPAAVLETPRLGLINVHASLLPKYRGAAPVHRAVMAGETVTGATIMRVVQALDAGPILARCERAIGPDETSEIVEQDLARVGAELLIAAIDDLAAGRGRDEPQDEASSTYAPRLTKAEGLIDWTRHARDIHNLVRGLHPWPHAHTFLRSRRLIVLRTALRPDRVLSAEPGTIIEARGATWSAVAGGGSVVHLIDVQSEGGRPLATREFLAGHAVEPGERFSSA